MEHKGTGKLETERLLLRPFTLKDAGAMYRNWASDPEVTKYLMWPPHENLDVTRTVLKSWIYNYNREDYYQWAIELKAVGEPIGSIGVNAYDNDTGMVHMGYCIGRKYWNRGYVTEALKRLIDYFFEEVGCHRVQSAHEPANPASGRVMEKAGMTYEGTLRQVGVSNRGIVDFCYYGILRDEWEKR